ncbi:hypothetical protein K413DRAFT_4767 [Clostridium sp. ASBs410]|nr:hypothetical protein K413DRAFT_4767 [Clostridium sp. ASBs410]
MIVHQVFAQIFNGEVKNVTVNNNYEEANMLARGAYGDSAFAVDISQYPCSPGDHYHDGKFWRVDENGNEVEEIAYVPTQEQQVSNLTGLHDETMETLVDLDYRQTALELGLT